MCEICGALKRHRTIQNYTFERYPQISQPLKRGQMEALNFQYIADEAAKVVQSRTEGIY